MKKKDVVLVDIDGTIADASHRLHFIQGDVKNWDEFFNNVDKDRPIPTVIRLVEALEAKYTIVFCTGRPDSIRRKTIAWLVANMKMKNGPILVMRKSGDRRPDYKVKKEMISWIQEELGCKLAFALEDRTQVVKMYRENGVTCLQVTDGDY